MQNNNVHRPNHYAKNGLTPVESFCNGLFSKEETKGFMVGNIIKYCCRFESKNGKEDLLKAREYIDLLIDYCYGDD